MKATDLEKYSSILGIHYDINLPDIEIFLYYFGRKGWEVEIKIQSHTPYDMFYIKAYLSNIHLKSHIEIEEAIIPTKENIFELDTRKLEPVGQLPASPKPIKNLGWVALLSVRKDICPSFITCFSGNIQSGGVIGFLKKSVFILGKMKKTLMILIQYCPVKF